MNAPRTETLIVYDPHTSKHVDMRVAVVAAFTLRGDCGCWPHRRTTFDIECIITPVLVGIRPAGSEESFRELAVVGSLSFFLENTIRYER